MGHKISSRYRSRKDDNYIVEPAKIDIKSVMN